MPRAPLGERRPGRRGSRPSSEDTQGLRRPRDCYDICHIYVLIGRAFEAGRSSHGPTPEIQPEQIAAQLGDDVRIEPLLLPRDCQDGSGEAFWGRPEAYLDPGVRAGMSAFGLLRRAETEPGLRRLSADLESGAWDARHGHLREADELDTGHRLIVAAPGARGPAAAVSLPSP